jgi:para-aminobenzoate synthetase
MLYHLRRDVQASRPPLIREAQFMTDPSLSLSVACDTIIAEIKRRQTPKSRPLLVALDGGSGSGKSTLGLLIKESLAVALVQSDDFFSAHIPDPEWDSRTVEEKFRDGINWRRLRTEALEPLLAGKTARWHPFDFVAGLRPDGTYGLQTDYVECAPAPVIILEGAHSARPELADLVDLSVLVEAPLAVRHARMAAREEANFLAQWHTRWDAVEVYYLTQVRPAASFDLVVNNG